MTALKLVFTVGLFLGAGVLAWTTDSVARDEAVAKVKKAAAFIKREAAAFAKFISEDVSGVPDAVSKRELRERSEVAAKDPESWSLGRSL
jgi:hypothetical protein